MPCRYEIINHNISKYINPSIKEGLIEMTIPDKPGSSKQKYVLSSKGRKFLNEID